MHIYSSSQFDAMGTGMQLLTGKYLEKQEQEPDLDFRIFSFREVGNVVLRVSLNFGLFHR
jgi:hypothetical protein